MFDFGDDWTHLCTVGDLRVDPLAVLGIIPLVPLPYWGWGDIPDQYRRLWDGDDGESDPPEDPGLSDLPPLRPWWGPGSVARQLRAARGALVVAHLLGTRNAQKVVANR